MGASRAALRSSPETCARSRFPLVYYEPEGFQNGITRSFSLLLSISLSLSLPQLRRTHPIAHRQSGNINFSPGPRTFPRRCLIIRPGTRRAREARRPAAESGVRPE